jgi:nitroreductase
LSVLNIIKERGSIRKYKDESIPKNKLTEVLEAARFAQSAANRQPWEFIVVTDPSIKMRLAEAARGQSFVGEAAAVIVCLADPNRSVKVGPFDGFLIDSAIALENMVLTAWDIGFGSCWIGAFNEERVKELLGIPMQLRVVSLLTLGYPDERPRAKNRKELDEIVRYEKYGQ